MRKYLGYTVSAVFLEQFDTLAEFQNLLSALANLLGSEVLPVRCWGVGEGGKLLLGRGREIGPEVSQFEVLDFEKC